MIRKHCFAELSSFMSETRRVDMEIKKDERSNISTDQHTHIGHDLPEAGTMDNMRKQSRAMEEHELPSSSFATTSSSSFIRKSKNNFSLICFVITIMYMNNYSHIYCNRQIRSLPQTSMKSL